MPCQYISTKKNKKCLDCDKQQLSVSLVTKSVLHILIARISSKEIGHLKSFIWESLPFGVFLKRFRKLAFREVDRTAFPRQAVRRKTGSWYRGHKLRRSQSLSAHPNFSFSKFSFHLGSIVKKKN